MDDRVAPRLQWAGRGLLCAFAILLLLSPKVPAQTLDASWQAPVSGSWTDASRWSTDPQYPTLTIEERVVATIAATGSPYIVSIDSTDVVLHELTLDSPDATLELQQGHLDVEEVLTIRQGNFVYLGEHLQVSGELQSYGRIELGDASAEFPQNLTAIFVENQGVLEVRGPVQLNSNTADLATDGTVHIHDGGQLVINATVVPDSLRNFTGDLSLRAVQIDGVYLNEGHVLDPHTLPAPDGRVFGQQSTLRGGTIASDTPYALGIEGEMTLDRVTIAGSLLADTYRIETVGELSLDSADVTISRGMSSSNGTFDPFIPITGQGRIRIHGAQESAYLAGKYNTESGIDLIMSSSTDGEAIVAIYDNDGTILCEGSDSRCRLSIRRNNGTVEIRGGQLELGSPAGYPQSTGPIVIDNGGMLNLTGEYSYPLFQKIENRSGQIVHNGQFLLQLNTLRMDSSQSVIGRIELGQVEIPRGETVLMRGVVPDTTVYGQLQVEDGGNEVAVDGVLNLDGGVAIFSATRASVETITGTGVVEFRGSPRLEVTSGELRLSSGLTYRGVGPSNPGITVDRVINQGVFQPEGYLVFYGSLVNEDHLILKDEATLIAEATELSPNGGGVYDVRDGQLMIGDMVLGSRDELQLQFSGDQITPLVATQNFTRNGSLEITFTEGYYPAAREVLEAVSWSGSVQGKFRQVSLPPTAAGTQWDTELLEERGQLRLINLNTRRIAGTAFLEPELGQRNYFPDETSAELGFTTQSSLTGGNIPYVGVDVANEGQRMMHRSVAATTTFETVDLAEFGLVELELDWSVSFRNNFDSDDLIRVSVTDGNDSINLVDLNLIRSTNITSGVFAIPTSWTSATVVMRTDTDSSNGDEWFALESLVFRGTPLDSMLPGDFNGNRVYDLGDLDILNDVIANGSIDMYFDRNQDGQLSTADRDAWIHNDVGSYYGDANLDGRFDSADLVKVFQAGEYEDGISQNSLWSTGDWNGDLEFGTGDLVLAFQDGGYTEGIAAAIVTPEPSALSLLKIVTILALAAQRGKRHPRKRFQN